jgi:uncharacterized protein YjlB
MPKHDAIPMEVVEVAPGAALPVAVYRAAFPVNGDAEETCERLFARHGWSGGWRNGIYGYHHFHAATHEVLGIARGHARVRFGSEDGPLVTVRAGDVVVIPAGVSHRNEGSSRDLRVVGAYPGGQEPDIQKGVPMLRSGLTGLLVKVPLPEEDPVSGGEGPLLQAWRR